MLSNTFGPKTLLANELYKEKYLQDGETFEQAMHRIADALADDETHKAAFLEILLNQRFAPAGRIQSAIGSGTEATAYNCFVSMNIPDSMNGIMDALKEAASTLRLGGGIGYCFSSIRPKGDVIKKLNSKSSGPLSFMRIFDQMCATISSSNHRRGAQMATFAVSHPDIREFINAKKNNNEFTNFNLSVLVTDAFMECVEKGSSFDLTFEGKVYETVDARQLWDEILESTWDWAEPAVLYVDRMNKKNNLWYCETIQATNPCAEQPLPAHGACLLGSFNLTKYISFENGVPKFDYDQFEADIPVVVRAQDNVVDRTVYPLPEQKAKAQATRRMGLGVTGLANAIEVQGAAYGTTEFLEITETILTKLRDTAYRSSIALAQEKGAFPALIADKYLQSDFVQTLPTDIRDGIAANGIRNSHLLSIAPTGTISMVMDNISSSIEPVFSEAYDRKIIMPDGEITTTVRDYGSATWGVKPRTANDVSVEEHVAVLNLASRLVDSACSKTCNVGSNVTFEEFKNVYKLAYDGGASGCSTFRINGKRFGILEAKEEPDTEEEIVEGAACFIDPNTVKTCE